MKVSPFLNVTSSGVRIRIEHGHLYDPFFVRNPRLYEWATRLGGLFLYVSPRLYRLWIAFERFSAYLRFRRTGILGEPREFSDAAHELSRRGFDAVSFGHTHHLGEFILENDKCYFNPGSWLLSCHFVEIDAGKVTLKAWTRGASTG